MMDWGILATVEATTAKPRNRQILPQNFTQFHPSLQEEVPVSPPSVASAFFRTDSHIGSKRRALNCFQGAAKAGHKTGVRNATGWPCKGTNYSNPSDP